jgi:SPOR domain
LLTCKPRPVYGVEAYYYLHVASYQTEASAEQDVERLKKKGLSAVAVGEQVPKKGYWYRVYIGPFSAHMEAYLEAQGLKKKKIVEYAAIMKKQFPIDSAVAQSSATGSKSPAGKASPKINQTKNEKITGPDKPVMATPAKPSSAKSSQKTQPPKAEMTSSPRYIGWPKEGYGRNMGGGKVALGFLFAYQEVDPDLTERTLTTSDGTTTTTQNVSIDGTENERNTSIDTASLSFRWGLTDWLEVFGSGGVSFYDSWDFNPAYGGGLRLNLFEVREGGLRGFYGALQGEYSAGTVEYDYGSTNGSEWYKEADWQEIFAKGELGIARRSFTGYVGGSYLNYQEDTQRQLLTNIPPPYISYVYNDDLEEKGFGAYGGVVINLSPSFLLNFEAQGFNKKGISGSIEYQF